MYHNPSSLSDDERRMPAIQEVPHDAVETARSRIRGARTLVVKVGSNVLVGGGGGVIDRRTFTALVEAIARLARVPGRRIVLVSSGAIAVGRRQHDRPQRVANETLSQKQALAAVGQPRLMHLYGEEFRFYGMSVAQLLLTRDDFDDRERFLNARKTLRELDRLEGVIPIVNENDTIASHEIRFGDNDSLAALVTSIVNADALLILSDVESLYTADPALHSDASPISVAWADDPVLHDISGPSTTGSYGTGGMASKVGAARTAAAWGVPTMIVGGRRPDNLGRALAGDTVGTLFVPRSDGLSSRKAWIRFGARPAGVVSIDRGAEVAIRAHGRSLLPGGITGVSGDFRAGAVVRIQTDDGVEIARGLTAYPSADLGRIAGLDSGSILAELGYHNGDAAVHRDDLALVDDLPADALG